MAKPIHEMSTWGHSKHQSRLPDEEWMATREMNELTQIQTKLMRQEEYLAGTNREIGRRVGDDRHELFVVCDPAEALVQHFEVAKPDFMAVHDINTDTSRRLVAGLAAATGRQVQKLLIRRQGHGTPLATLEFAELAGPGGQVLRVYTTLADADTRQRHLIAAALLAHCRLGVVMAGDLPPHALNTALEPVHEAMLSGHWPNRNMIFIPLGSTSAITAAAAVLGSRSGVNVRVTPQASKPNDAWGYISLAWDRLRQTGTINPPSQRAYGSADRNSEFMPTAQSALDQVPPAPLPMKPMPSVPAASSEAAAPAATAGGEASAVWQRYTQNCAAIKGMVSCCVFDLGSQRTLAHAGARPGPATMATRGGALYDALIELARGLGLPGGQPEAGVTLAGHHVLLRPVPGHPGLMLHAVLDAAATDLPSAQAMVSRIHPVLGVAQAA